MGEAIETVSDRKRALLEAALRKRRQQAARAAAIPRRGDSGPAPLSFAQQRIWFLEQWEPGAPTFNGARATRLRGELDVAALRRAFEAIVERHESLRSVVAMREREPSQVALDTWSLELPIVDLQSLPAGEQEAELGRILRELSREPFDLAADLMLRATLIRLAQDDAVLLVRMHHIAADGFSDRVLFGELRELYDAFRAGRTPGPSRAAAPVRGLRRLAARAAQRPAPRRARRALDRPRSKARRALLRLPIDRPRRTVQRHEGVHHDLRLPKEIADGIVAVSRAEGVTVFMALLAAFSALLYRVTGEDDVVIGCPIANRTNTELEGLIGLFSNTIALRSRLGGNPSFRELLGRVRETTLAAYAHQELPFEKLVEALRVGARRRLQPALPGELPCAGGRRGRRWSCPGSRARRSRSTSASRASTWRSSSRSRRTASPASWSTTRISSTAPPSWRSSRTSRRCSSRRWQHRRRRSSRCGSRMAAPRRP